MSAFERTWTVRFSDTDPFGIAHYPRIVDAVHETSDIFMQEVGFPFWELSLEHDLGLPIVEVDLEFRSSVRAGDEVLVTLQTDLGESSVRFDYEGAVNGETAFFGFEQRVCVPPGSDQSVAIPDDLRAALATASED